MAIQTQKPSRPTPVYRGGTAPMPAITATPPAQKPKLLDQVRQAIRTRHYSPRTEETYVHWIKRFIFFHNKRHPAETGRERNRPLPLQPGKRATCKRVHAEPGIKPFDNSVSLPTGLCAKYIGYVDAFPECLTFRPEATVAVDAAQRNVERLQAARIEARDENRCRCLRPPASGISCTSRACRRGRLHAVSGSG